MSITRLFKPGAVVRTHNKADGRKVNIPPVEGKVKGEQDVKDIPDIPSEIVQPIKVKKVVQEVKSKKPEEIKEVIAKGPPAKKPSGKGSTARKKPAKKPSTKKRT